MSRMRKHSTEYMNEIFTSLSRQKLNELRNWCVWFLSHNCDELMQNET